MGGDLTRILSIRYFQLAVIGAITSQVMLRIIRAAVTATASNDAGFGLLKTVNISLRLVFASAASKLKPNAPGKTENPAERRLQPVRTRGHHGFGARRPSRRAGLQRAALPRALLTFRRTRAPGGRIGRRSRRLSRRGAGHRQDACDRRPAPGA